MLRRYLYNYRIKIIIAHIVILLAYAITAVIARSDKLS